MSAVALVKQGEALDAPDRAIQQLREQRKALVSLENIEALLTLRAWAEVVGGAARAKRAKQLATEAAETQIRAERRLGLLLLADRRRGHEPELDASAPKVATWVRLAEIPERLFESVVAGMLERGLACSAPYVFRNARRDSLKPVEPGIWTTFDGVYATKTEFGRWEFHDLYTRSSLDEIREIVREGAGLRKGWAESKVRVRLDDAHSRSRRLAQALSLLGETSTGDVRKMIGEAELLQSKVAGLLYAAWNEAVMVESGLAA